MATIHQYAGGYVTHWKEGPGWVRDGSEIANLRRDGMRRLIVQLQDDGPIPPEQTKEWRDAGVQVWGMVGHVNEWEKIPTSLAAWLKSERVRLSLTGLDCNFEDEVLGFDQRTNGLWSSQFASHARAIMPTLPMHLDSYWGPMGAGINLGAYKANGFRFSVQTAWGQPPEIWADPTTNIVRKGLGAQPIIPKSIIKPIFFITEGAGGQLLDPAVALTDTKQAGTLGCGFYYIDGRTREEVSDWVQRARAAGVCA